MANSISFRSPAKLNLFLHIVGRRSDSYHLLQTVFQFVDLCDTLNFEVRDASSEISLSAEMKIPPNPPSSKGGTIWVPPFEKGGPGGIFLHQNLALRAAHLLQQRYHVRKGAHIHLEKRIPIGGGLGGGSSNAAVTLRALNELWDLHLSRDELATLGLTLGADVPVFIHGKTAWAEGVGEQLRAITLPEPWYLILTPPCAVETAKIYADPELTRDTPPLTMEHFLQGLGKNDFQSLICKRYPEVAKAIEWLDQFTHARLTGSGSSVFGAFTSEDEARAAAKRVPSPLTGFVAKGLNCF